MKPLAVAFACIFLGVGSALALALSVLIQARRAKTRPQFTFARLLLFTLALSAAAYGGVRWYTWEPPSKWDLEEEKVLRHSLDGKRIDYRAQHERLRDSVRNMNETTVLSLGILLDPALEDAPATSTFDLKDATAREILDEICRQTGAVWEFRVGILYVHSPGRSCFQDPPAAHALWETLALQRLAVRVGPQDTCTLREECDYIKQSCGVACELAPGMDPGPLEMLGRPFIPLRGHDRLDWLCYFANAEWSLKPTPDGQGKVWIEPKHAK